METHGYNSLTSWLIVIACSFIGSFVMVPMRLAGLFFVIIFDGFNTDRGKASVPIVIFGILRTLLGALVGFLGETFGFRAITLTGCVLAAVGVGCCFFAEDITTIIICLGIIYGLGIACANTLIPTILKLHFTEHINLVNGIVLSGSCAGAIVMSPVITFLHTTYGTNGMFLILGGIFLNCIPPAMLLRHPHNERRKLNEGKDVADYSNQTISCHQNPAFIADEEKLYQKRNVLKTPVEYESKDRNCKSNEVKNVIEHTEDSIGDEKKGDNISGNVSLELNDTCNYPSSRHKTKSNINIFPIAPDIELRGYLKRKSSFEKISCKNRFSTDENFVNNISRPSKVKVVAETRKRKITCKSFRIFADPTFHFIMFVQSLHAFVTTLNWTVVVDYARDKGMPNDISVYLVMSLPFAETIGNVCFSWITDRHFMTRTNFSVICFLLLVLDAIFLIWSYDFEIMMVGVFILGTVSGAVQATFPGIIVEFISEEQQNMAIASRLSLYAILCFLKAPIIGYFRGTLGSYDWVYCIIMACSLTCTVFVTLTPLLASCRKKKMQLKEIT